MARVQEQSSFYSMLICHCDLQMEDFLVGDHDLEHEVGLDEMEVFAISGVGW